MNRQLEHNETNNKTASAEIVLICDGVNGPANMGSIFRLSDAFGVARLYFTNAVDTGSGRFRKTARSTYSWVDYQDLIEPETIVQNYKQQGFYIVALEITQDSSPLQALDHSERVCLIVGGENHGISPEVLRLADRTVHIDMHGANSSINVAQATAILLYQLNN